MSRFPAINSRKVLLPSCSKHCRPRPQKTSRCVGATTDNVIIPFVRRMHKMLASVGLQCCVGYCLGRNKRKTKERERHHPAASLQSEDNSNDYSRNVLQVCSFLANSCDRADRKTACFCMLRTADHSFCEYMYCVCILFEIGRSQL